MPKFTHYVSLSNKCVYPAMSHPDGFEDAHPEDYRPATQAEIAAYAKGVDRTQNDPSELPPEPVSVSPAASTPTIIALSPEPAAPEAPEAPTFVPPPPPPPSFEN